MFARKSRSLSYPRLDEPHILWGLAAKWRPRDRTGRAAWRALAVFDAQQEAKKTTNRPCLSAFVVLVTVPSRWSEAARSPIQRFGNGSMLDTRFARTPEAEGLAPPQSGDPLPAIVVKAQEDARCRLALARLGYSTARSEYARHKREGKDTFESLGRDSLWPTMDFVRAWLKEERRRVIARARWPFLLTMLVTIVAGLAFAIVAAMLG